MNSRIESAVQLGVDREVAEQAIANLDSGVLALCISGKLGSGKDSSAEMVFRKLGVENPQLVMFAGALKDEIDEVIGYIKDSRYAAEVTEKINVLQNVPLEQAETIAKLLFQEVKSGEVKTSRDRTVNSRTALQLWGTEIRRTQDPLYWVKRSSAQLMESIAEGKDTYVTDARFVNEMEAMLSFGIPVVRLDVSYEEQSRRINGRDGVVVTAEARAHVSETALDDFENFTLRIDTDLAGGVGDVADLIIRNLFSARD